MASSLRRSAPYRRTGLPRALNLRDHGFTGIVSHDATPWAKGLRVRTQSGRGIMTCRQLPSTARRGSQHRSAPLRASILFLLTTHTLDDETMLLLMLTIILLFGLAVADVDLGE